jgi:hypothetical protein
VGGGGGGEVGGCSCCRGYEWEECLFGEFEWKVAQDEKLRYLVVIIYCVSVIEGETNVERWEK